MSLGAGHEARQDRFAHLCVTKDAEKDELGHEARVLEAQRDAVAANPKLKKNQESHGEKRPR